MSASNRQEYVWSKHTAVKNVKLNTCSEISTDVQSSSEHDIGKPKSAKPRYSMSVWHVYVNGIC